jgi:hypothetical protein
MSLIAERPVANHPPIRSIRLDTSNLAEIVSGWPSPTSSGVPTSPTTATSAPASD